MTRPNLKLPPGFERAHHYGETGGLTHSQIAVILGISRQAVYATERRALNKLRERLNEQISHSFKHSTDRSG